MNNLSLNSSNWQEVKAEGIVKLKPIACKGEFARLENAISFNQLFSVMFENYVWLKNNCYSIDEIEGITPIQWSQFMVWLLESYCLGKGVDNVVKAVIDLHKRRLDGDEPSKEEWEDARDAARAASAARCAWAASAARSAARADWEAGWEAAWEAAWFASEANWQAAWQEIITKLIELIYE